jgi:uncharacterized membrane protein YtjA (UPF0391 family)
LPQLAAVLTSHPEPAQGFRAYRARGGNSDDPGLKERGMTLLKWALICLLISLVAGALGYTGVAAGAAKISKILFFIFLVAFLVIVILAIVAGQLVF